MGYYYSSDEERIEQLTYEANEAERKIDELRDELSAQTARAEEAEASLAEREEALRECNAVCLCGCPDDDHEADECGESCGHDDHECIRVPRSVLAYVETLRGKPASDEVREAAGRYRVASAAARDCRRAHATYRYETICDEKDERDIAAIALAEKLVAALSRPAPCPACGRTGKGCACTIEERDAALSRPAAKGGPDDAR